MDDDTNHDRGQFEGEVTAELRNLVRRIDELLPWMRQHEDRLRALELVAAQGRVWGRVLTVATGIMAGGFSGWLAKWLAK